MKERNIMTLDLIQKALLMSSPTVDALTWSVEAT